MSFQQRQFKNLHQMLQHPKEDDCQWYEVDVNRFMEQCCQPAQKGTRRMPESVQDPQRRNDQLDEDV